MTNDSLIQRYRDGDEDAFRELFDRYEATLRARLAKWLSPAVLRKVSVADLIQETRITAFRRRHDFENRGPHAFRRWLLGIIEMKARRALQLYTGAAKRDVGREVSRGQRPDTAYFAGHDPSPSQVAIAAELRELARKALDALPPDHRKVMELVRERHLSMGEAAVHLGRTREATKKLYGRALFKFTEVFERLRGSDGG